MSLVAVIASSVAAIGAFLTAYYEMQHDNLERRPALHLTCRSEYRLAEMAQHLPVPQDTLLLTTNGGRIIHVGGDLAPAGAATGAWRGLAEPFARCSVQNFGRLPMFDIRVPLRLTFTSSTSVGRNALAHVDIPGLASDASYEFSMLNGSSQDLRFAFEPTIELSSIDMTEGTAQRLFTDEGLADLERVVVPSALRVAVGERAMSGRVTIRNFAYEPPELLVRRGATVTFLNTDNEAHTAASTDGSFDSGTIEAGALWRHVFPVAGRFVFRCAFHPYMRGVVIVH